MEVARKIKCAALLAVVCVSLADRAEAQSIGASCPTSGWINIQPNEILYCNNSTLWAIGVEITSGGNVGIGTAVPTYALDVASGSIISRGTFVETASDTGAIIGMNSSTPRLWLGNGTSAQNLEIDNNGGVMRFISPGNIIMQASASPNTVTVNGILNATNYVVVGGTTSLNHSLDIYEHSGQAIAALNRSGNSDNMYFQLSPAGANSNSNVNWLMGVNGGSDKFSLGTWNGSSVATYLTINDNSGNGYVGIGSSSPTQALDVSGNIAVGDVSILSAPSAAVLHLGAADAAAPVAQTLGVQNVVAGTSNTAGADFNIVGSQGTGTGSGGRILFKVAPAAGSSGTTQNALGTSPMYITPLGGGGIVMNGIGASAPDTINTQIGLHNGNQMLTISSGGGDVASIGTYSSRVDGFAYSGISLGPLDFFGWSSNSAPEGGNWVPDTVIGRQAAATIQLGGYDYGGSPTAQFFGAQGVHPGGGRTNVAGANWTIYGSRGLGNAAGGDIIFQTALPGASGGTQNALVTAMQISGTTGDVGIGSTSPVSSLDVSQKTDAVALPAGTTAQRPSSPVNGMVRYNNSNTGLEGYVSSAWAPLPGGMGLCHAVYNYAVDGGGTGTITPATNCTIPAHAILISSIFNPTTGLSSGGGADIQIGISGGSVSAFQTNLSYTNFGTNALMDGSVSRSSPIKTTTSGNITFTINYASLTAGVVEIWIEYYVAAN